MYKINYKFNIKYYFNIYEYKIGFYKIKYLSNNLSNFINIIDLYLNVGFIFENDINDIWINKLGLFLNKLSKLINL